MSNSDTFPASPGDYVQTIEVGELTRQYRLHLPPQFLPDRPWPLVMAFHGGGVNDGDMQRFSGLDAKADEEGFVVVFPNGSGRIERARTWNAGGNCCGYARRYNIDDVGFVRTLMAELQAKLPIDAGRIFATGMSNGAALCYLLADELSEQLAAIAPVAGPMGREDCSPSRPVPILHFHGTKDEFTRYDGGVGAKSLSRTHFHSVEHTINNWVRANGCNPLPEVTRLPGEDVEQMFIERYRYPDGDQGSEVLLYKIHNGGHTWPGRDSEYDFLGPSTKLIDANELIWDFFEKHGGEKGREVRGEGRE
ncbi:Polyhydroxybutyrate depolymerase [Planctomycetales bacterium 10988]|nr:Polyhydroxybutyrate depolymerase [Planctomycetales bacterium 10988]